MAAYVDNKKLAAEVITWVASRKEALANNQPIPQIPEYTAISIMKIADKLSKKANFAGYSFRLDMAAEAMEQCIRYLYAFNGEKSQNAFAYITQIAHNAFIRYLQREQKYAYIKSKIVENTDQIDSYNKQPSDVGNYGNAYVTFLKDEQDTEVIARFEDRKARARQKNADRAKAAAELTAT